MIEDHEEGASISELGEIYGISRKTVYKWLERHEERGVLGLADLSRRPHGSPSQVSAEVEAAIVAARQRWKWGPRKLRVKLCLQDEACQWPCVSTIASVLKSKGLIVTRRRKAHTPVQKPPYAAAEESNGVWCADYKGYFRTSDGTRIDPLTITDAASRYLLRCQIVERTDFTHARTVFEAAFREFGMPVVIHTDNGAPFASVAPGGLSRLSMWFVKLGITPERSRPGSPQDNGRHERMHRTLKQATAAPPQPTLRLQQKAFDAFRREFNEQRPHEALADLTPAACYQAGARSYPPRVPELQYGDDFEVRRVSQQGSIKWNGERTFISEIFGYESLGLKPLDDRWLRIYYGPIPLGWLDGHRHRFSRILPRELKSKNLSNETRINTTQSVTPSLHLSAATAQPQG
jgi:transposase InsO family protein